jgi:hypothetical protein
MGNIATTGGHIVVQIDQKDEAICGGSKLTGTVYLIIDKESISGQG